MISTLATLALAVLPELLQFEPLLIPMHHGNARGAIATQWRVEDIVFNGSDRPVRYFPEYPALSFFGEPVIGQIPPRSSPDESQFVAPNPCRINCDRPPGAIIWIHPDASHAVTAYSRVFELTADHDNYGAVVPAVRASEFRRNRLSLAGIRIGTNFRATIRVYNMAQSANMVVSVTNRNGVVLSEQEYFLPAAYSADHEYGVATVPGYAQLNLDRGTLRVDEDSVNVTVASTSSAFWGFASVTSNSSQRVTIITP